MPVVFGLVYLYFTSTFFPLFRLSFFPGPISIRIATFWAQLLLEFSTDHFETAYLFYMI